MSKRKRILIVEDDPLQASNTAVRLESMGYQILEPVDSGQDAVRIAEAERPDLVLMDIILQGDMDGIDAARRIARLSIPVIYLTSHVDLGILERAKLTEPLGFIVKPFTDREMLATVTMAIYRSEMEHQLAEFKAVVDQARHDNDTEQHMLLRLLNNLPGMMYRRNAIQSPAGFDYLNAGAARLTGYPIEQLKSGAIDFLSLIDSQDRERVLTEQNSARTGNGYQVEYQLTDAKGRKHAVRETGYGVLSRSGEYEATEAYITTIA